MTVEHTLADRVRFAFGFDNEPADELHTENIDEQMLSSSKSNSSISSVVDILDVVEQYEDVRELIVAKKKKFKNVQKYLISR